MQHSQNGLSVGICTASSVPLLIANTGGGINWTGGTVCAAGLTCIVQNPYYSQCLATPANSVNTGATLVATTSPKSSHISMPVTQLSSSQSSSSKVAAASSTSNAITFKASFTHYGAGDSFGSPNCNTNTAACGFFTFPGFSAAVSQNL